MEKLELLEILKLLEIFHLTDKIQIRLGHFSYAGRPPLNRQRLHSVLLVHPFYLKQKKITNKQTNKQTNPIFQCQDFLKASRSPSKIKDQRSKMQIVLLASFIHAHLIAGLIMLMSTKLLHHRIWLAFWGRAFQCHALPSIISLKIEWFFVWGGRGEGGGEGNKCNCFYYPANTVYLSWIISILGRPRMFSIIGDGRNELVAMATENRKQGSVFVS